MKYWIMQIAVLVVVIWFGYWTRYSDWFPVTFGLCLFVYAFATNYFMYKRAARKEQKEYDAWVVEMNERSSFSNSEQEPYNKHW